MDRNAFGINKITILLFVFFQFVACSSSWGEVNDVAPIGTYFGSASSRVEVSAVSEDGDLFVSGLITESQEILDKVTLLTDSSSKCICVARFDKNLQQLKG